MSINSINSAELERKVTNSELMIKKRSSENFGG